MKALFVCTGNSCRSVMAEFLMRHLASTHGLDVEAKSCGIAAERSFAIPESVKKALARYDIDRVDHSPRLVNKELVQWATDVFAMTAKHREALESMYPEHRGKIHLFLEKAGLGARDVDDPIGRPLERYLECCDSIELALKKILDIHDNTPANPRP